MKNFEKPFLNVDQQIQKLVERGLVFDSIFRLV